MTWPQIISGLVVGLITALASLVVGMFAASRTLKAKQLELSAQKEKSDNEATATIRVGLIGNRDTHEERLVTRVEALEKKVEEERSKRHELEEKSQTNKLEIQELRAEIERMRAEKFRLSQVYQEQIIGQDKLIHDLQDQLTDLQKKYAELQNEYEQLMKVCQTLQTELAKERGQAVEHVLTLAKNIGGTEAPPRVAKRKDEGVK